MFLANATNNPKPSINTITSSINLDNSYVGSENFCNLSTDISIGLPDAGYFLSKKINFFAYSTNESLATFSNGISIGSGESVTFKSTGATWIVDNSNFVQSRFCATPFHPQTLTTGVPDTLVLDNYSTLGCDFSPSTASFYLPGMYAFTSKVKLAPVTAATQLLVDIMLNGTSIMGDIVDIPSGKSIPSVIPPFQYPISKGDEIWVQVEQISGADQDIDVSDLYCFFAGQRISYL